MHFFVNRKYVTHRKHMCIFFKNTPRPRKHVTPHCLYKAERQFQKSLRSTKALGALLLLSRATTSLRNLATTPRTTPKKKYPRPWTPNLTLNRNSQHQNTILFYNKVEKFPHPHQKTEVYISFTTV